ncbi:hypothetical protein Tco_0835250 [Tanacetum coccineum]
MDEQGQKMQQRWRLTVGASVGKNVPEGTRVGAPCPLYKASKRFHSGRCGIDALAIFWLDSAVFFPNDNKLTISFVNQLRIYERHEDEQNFIVSYTSTNMG